MLFRNGKELAVLESKFEIYEDLSKSMLDKLERAVSSISENSNKISIILERHENKIAESAKADALMLKMLEEVKIENSKDHKEVKSRINGVEEKIQELSKFRWQVGGVLIIAGLVLGSLTSGIASKILTFGNLSTTITEQVR